MKNVLKIIIAILFFSSCTQSSGDDDFCLRLAEPDKEGLVPHHQLSFKVSDDFMPTYDSLILFYNIVVNRPKWSNSHHDSILIQRHKHPSADSNYWDRAELYGWEHGRRGWTMICQLNLMDSSSNREDYSVMTALIDEIALSMEGTLYYIDDDDWKRNIDFYQNYKGKDWLVCGQLKIR